MVESGAWPWVGRGRELRQIVAAMDASHAAAGVVLTGPRGVGKTRIAGEALNRCEGAEARWTAGTPAGRAVPLGALVDWVPDGVENPPHSMERVIAHLVGGATQRSVVVVVDDVHLPDDASAFLLHRIIDRRRAKVLLTARTGVEVPDAVAALSRAAVLQRIELPFLGRQESASLLASALGGAVDPVVARRVWTLTQGNVRYLRSLVEHHVSSGQLRRADGMWTWGSEPVIPDEVCELVEEEMGRPTDEVAEALDLLAVANRLPVRVLVGLVGPRAVEEAERRSLIVADDGPEPVVHLVYPLFGEARRTRLGRIRLRRLRGTVAAVLCDQPEPSAAAIVQRALLLVDWTSNRTPPNCSEPPRPRCGGRFRCVAAVRATRTARRWRLAGEPAPMR